ncbi:MAG: hypothetical protein JWQ21_1061, partial [Herminiimonas sp.]|nr:hypothetical protein [Herminiimonas sp.]
MPVSRVKTVLSRTVSARPERPRPIAGPSPFVLSGPRPAPSRGAAYRRISRHNQSFDTPCGLLTGYSGRTGLVVDPGPGTGRLLRATGSDRIFIDPATPRQTNGAMPQEPSQAKLLERFSYQYGVMRVGLGCRARREERSVASHTSDEQRRHALQSGPQRPYTDTKTALSRRPFHLARCRLRGNECIDFLIRFPAVAGIFLIESDVLAVG